MAASPKYKVFDAHGTYQGACKEIEGAACLIGLYGDGATIRVGHAKRDIIWTEGEEDFPASESYDMVVDVVLDRIADRRERFNDWMKREGIEATDPLERAYQIATK